MQACASSMVISPMTSALSIGRQWPPMLAARTCGLDQPSRSSKGALSRPRTPPRIRPSLAVAGGGPRGPTASGGSGGGGGGGDSGRDQSLLALTTALYAALVTGFGYLGYKKRGSRQSLITSATAAGCLLLAALMTCAPGWQRLGLLWGAGSCAGLATVMGQRWAASPSRSFMPAGAVTSSAALLGIAHLWAVL